MIAPDLYAQGRARYWAAHSLAERPAGFPLTEHLLQLIWQHQRLRVDQLLTTGNQAVRVLHPGFWNHEPGPDFRGAIVQFGDALAQHGDVEVDLAPSNWHSHGHDCNPNFKNVILHVVWHDEGTTPRPLPTLALKARLDAPIEELGSWLRQEPRLPPVNILGRCSNPLHRLAKNQLEELLRQAGQTRLQSKADQLQARARQVGWEQALWQGLFAALGYKNNAWPMRRLAEVLPTILADQPEPGSALNLQARLLGVSGLLSGESGHASGSANAYLRNVWNLWWREQEQFAEITLPGSMWRLGALRPANHPQRRLALAAHWLAGADLPHRLERWFSTAQPLAKPAQSLLEVLQPGLDEFWSHHWTFNSVRLPVPQPLIGPPRVTDLAMNVILPWFWVRAAIGQNGALQRLAEECYFAWPKAEENAILRLAEKRLFGEGPAPGFRTAAMQQGVLQIVRDFCDYSNALCERCPFPRLVDEAVCGD
jgi:hypothetical protein